VPALGSPEIPCGTQVVVLDEVQFMEASRFSDDVLEGVCVLLLTGVGVVAASLGMGWQAHPFRSPAGLRHDSPA
jgi:thymidine kinase